MNARLRAFRYFLCLVGLLCLWSTSAFASRGEVTHRISSCDYFVVETNKGFAILEWYGGHDPDKGDVIVGAFESYGFKNVYDETADAELKVYVEDFFLSKSAALEELYDKCE